MQAGYNLVYFLGLNPSLNSQDKFQLKNNIAIAIFLTLCANQVHMVGCCFQFSIPGCIFKRQSSHGPVRMNFNYRFSLASLFLVFLLRLELNGTSLELKKCEYQDFFIDIQACIIFNTYFKTKIFRIFIVIYNCILGHYLLILSQLLSCS